MGPEERAALHAYYERGEERDRLDGAIGRVELVRTQEILLRHLPTPPATIADIGGGPGRYSAWLADLGHRVHHRDVVPLHVDQAAEATAGTDLVDAAVGDALDIDLPDESVDAVLLLGPLYHLPDRGDRLRALAEARRIVRPGHPVFVVAITRWAGRLHSVLAQQLHHAVPNLLDRLPDLERTGVMAPLFPGSFTGYGHRPDELRREIRAADLGLVDLVNVEGPAALLPDLAERLAEPIETDVVLDAARAVERVPELLGVGPHLLATARRPAAAAG